MEVDSGKSGGMKTSVMYVLLLIKTMVVLVEKTSIVLSAIAVQRISWI